MPLTDLQGWEFWLLDSAVVGWFVLQILVAMIALVILVSSLDDIIVDITYWALKIRRAFRPNPYGLPDTAAELEQKEERPLAVMVPAWDESAVIARMIANTIANIKYTNYHIFVGVYSNDEATRNEVDRMSRMYPTVHRVDVGHPGPTSKADCLNWLIQGIFLFEEQHNMTFAGVLLHDAEDVIHPYSFKLVNWVLPYLDLIQLPVYSMPRKLNQFVASHYMDEFAEWHTKDMVVREFMTGIVPSAGVATAFSRLALSKLVQTEDGLPFNTDSLTEDYDVAQRIQELGLRGGFVRHEIEQQHTDDDGKVDRRKEVICTREFFPDRFKYSVKQKSRWMLGIAYVGFEQIGWRGSLGNRYFLYRDRKGIVTSPVSMLAYFIVLNIIAYSLWVALAPTAWRLPTLVESGSVTWYLVMVNLAFLAVRVAHRAYFVTRLHGWAHGALSALRIPVSNAIAFFAHLRATRQYFVGKVTGKKLTWDKTSHSYPSASEILNGRARLGEVLTQMGAVRPQDVDAALAIQETNYRPLGLLLLDRASISDEALAAAFGELAGFGFESFNVHHVPDHVVAMIPQRIAARFGAFPICEEQGRLIIGLREPLSKAQQVSLIDQINPQLKVTFVLSPRSDISFAIRFAFDGHLLDEAIRDLGLLQRLKVLSAEQVDLVWKGIRRSYVPFADLAVKLGYLGHAELAQRMEYFWSQSNVPFVGDYLASNGLLTDEQVNEILSIQARECLDPLTVAANLGLISESNKVHLEKERERL